MKFAPLITTTSIAIGLAMPIFAAGSGTPEKPKPTQTTMECEKGFVWDEKTEKCVEIEESNLNDDQIYQNARELAYANQYENALRLLDMAANPRDPRILTYKGYAHRKAGRVDLANTYYTAALEIDPTNITARSYMGQGMLRSGNTTGAVDQLIEIASLSGKDNWPYRALANAIRGDLTTDY
ncbi:hypothetical protein BFP76_07465 [Amylibacter kogurei]|uniref:Uncharacterized protein n=1 Tax=Paramylibacter kogurei TaxID=1889778 RepID=A0A2G5K773_9RHOB|nr:tetratricopeptide repeat protein [Amylibacter kogurei]PIB24979.1 hypothetical protein BFP76_07465 [Amylibacter kogurei]